MRSHLFVLPLLAVCLGVAGGCQKLNYEKSHKLEAHSLYDIEFSAPTYQQKVSVTIMPEASAVSAYLCKEADKDKVKNAIDTGKPPPAELLLASKVSEGAVEPYSFEATVPRGTAYVLVLKGGKKATEVKVKLVGR
jgi:hypothetical protein